MLALLFWPFTTAAQELIVPLQLSFSDPGARSMGFGGAFVALADDATAAFANPAGLEQLLKPELSIEARSWAYSSPFTEAGRAEGMPSGNGIDNVDGLRTSTSEFDTADISFLSFAYPGDQISLAAFKHTYANLDFASETQGIFAGGTDCCQQRNLDQRATSSFDVESFGLAASYRVSDRLNVGISAVYYDVRLTATVTQYLTDDDSLASLFRRNSYLPERSVISQTSTMDESDWGLTAGFLWKPAARWSIGGVYRQAPEVSMHAEVYAGQAVDFGVPPGDILVAGTAGPVEFPDVIGLGFAYRAMNEHLTLSFQFDHIEYSSIPESIGVDDQTIDDVIQVHVGAEYVFLDSTPIIAVRLGAWFDPDHQMRATADEPYLRALLPAGEDEIHFAAGIGVAVKRFQIDVAMDIADRVDTVSLSAVYNFR